MEKTIKDMHTLTHTLNYENIKRKCYEIREAMKHQGKGNELEFEALLDKYMADNGISHDTTLYNNYRLIL